MYVCLNDVWNVCDTWIYMMKNSDCVVCGKDVKLPWRGKVMIVTWKTRYLVNYVTVHAHALQDDRQ